MEKKKDYLNIVWIAILIVIIVVLAVVLVRRLNKDNSLETGVYLSEDNIEYNIYQDLLLRDITIECCDVKDYSVLTEYIYLCGIPEGGCSFAWELCEGDEISYVDSSKGILNYTVDRNYVIIELDGSVSELQVVLYVKTNNLENSLNNIFVSNENLKVLYGFNIQVYLPDKSKKVLGRNTIEDDLITLKDYLKKVKFED